MVGASALPPLFIPRAVSPLSLSPLESEPRFIILPGSSDDDTPELRRTKKQRRETQGYRYLRDRQPYLISSQLRGPLHTGWKNPWAKRAKASHVQHGRGYRSSSPIDLTSDPEGTKAEVRVEHARERSSALGKSWLKSNVRTIREHVRDGRSVSPCPKGPPRGYLPATTNRKQLKYDGGDIETSSSDDEHEEPISLKAATNYNNLQEASLEMPDFSSQDTAADTSLARIGGGHARRKRLREERSKTKARISMINDQLELVNNDARAKIPLRNERQDLNSQVSTVRTKIALGRQSSPESGTRMEKRGTKNVGLSSLVTRITDAPRRRTNLTRKITSKQWSEQPTEHPPPATGGHVIGQHDRNQPFRHQDENLLGNWSRARELNLQEERYISADNGSDKVQIEERIDKAPYIVSRNTSIGKLELRTNELPSPMMKATNVSGEDRAVLATVQTPRSGSTNSSSKDDKSKESPRFKGSIKSVNTAWQEDHVHILTENDDGGSNSSPPISKATKRRKISNTNIAPHNTLYGAARREIHSSPKTPTHASPRGTLQLTDRAPSSADLFEFRSRRKISKRVAEPVSEPESSRLPPKRRLSFTSSGQVRYDVGLRIPQTTEAANSAESQPLRLKPSPTELSKIAPDRQYNGDQAAKKSNDDSTDVSGEAQIVEPLPAKLLSGSSTSLMETDKQSLKFPNARVTDSEMHTSTQDEAIRAQRSFQTDLISPIETASNFPQSSKQDDAEGSNLGCAQETNAPLRTFCDPFTGAFRSGTNSQEPLSTQAMVEAMSPFTFSTVKKSGGFLNALAKPATAIMGYIRTQDSSQDGHAHVDTYQHLTMHGLPSSKDLAADGAFGNAGLVVETSSSPSGFSYDLSQTHQVKDLRRTLKTKYGNMIPVHSDSSDVDVVYQSSPVRENKGRQVNHQSLSQSTLAKLTLRSLSTASQSAAQQQDGQQMYDEADKAIDEAGSFLGTWDVEKEVEKFGGP